MPGVLRDVSRDVIEQLILETSAVEYRQAEAVA
jgi:hypothetical protein